VRLDFMSDTREREVAWIAWRFLFQNSSISTKH